MTTPDPDRITFDQYLGSVHDFDNHYLSVIRPGENCPYTKEQLTLAYKAATAKFDEEIRFWEDHGQHICRKFAMRPHVVRGAISLELGGDATLHKAYKDICLTAEKEGFGIWRPVILAFNALMKTLDIAPPPGSLPEKIQIAVDQHFVLNPQVGKAR